MNGPGIGIKVADGSFYPVLEKDFKGQKKLVLTTVRDNQSKVQIDLYQGQGERAEQTEYVGTLIIENIKPAPKNEPEIEVVLGVDESGNLNASANDLLTGEQQSLSVSLESLDAEGLYAIPEFEMEANIQPPEVDKEFEEFEEALLTGETYPIGTKDRRKEHLERRKRNPLVLIGFVLLGVLLIAGIAYIIFRSLKGPIIPPILGGEKTTISTMEETPISKEQQAAQTEESEKIVEEEKQPSPAKKDLSPGIWYDIKRGDTLWDIASSYYRNPWLYPKIAKANGIRNPDIIFAGQKLFIPEN